MRDSGEQDQRSAQRHRPDDGKRLTERRKLNNKDAAG